MTVGYLRADHRNTAYYSLDMEIINYLFLLRVVIFLINPIYSRYKLIRILHTSISHDMYAVLL